jgi:glycerol kinase
MNYILVIDQSTQGTKGILLDDKAKIIYRCDLAHKQILDEKGWISHNLEEIYNNILSIVSTIIKKPDINANNIKALGICNQRETTAIWDKNGTPLNEAVVWQCSRAKNIIESLKSYENKIYERTGLPLSPYFSAAKMNWLISNISNTIDYRIGTIDTWLIYKLTEGKSYFTDYSNASRTQLLDLEKLCWSSEICNIFGISPEKLPQIVDSNAFFGETDFEGILPKKLPIVSVMGDSQSAMYAQKCNQYGMAKATYGTGCSVMVNSGIKPIRSKNMLNSSVAWCIDKKTQYVIEANIHYAGGIITWLKNKLKLFNDTKDIENLIKSASKKDKTVLIPNFSDYSSHHNNLKAIFCGMGISTGKSELIKSGVESIAYQVMDIIEIIEKDINSKLLELHTDGGATSNNYLMQFQADLTQKNIKVSNTEELSAIGVGILAGITIDLYEKESIFKKIKHTTYRPNIIEKERIYKINLWRNALNAIFKNNKKGEKI